MILFWIALCVASFYDLFFIFRLFHSAFHFWGSILFSTLQGSFNLCYFTFLHSSVSFWSVFCFYQCPEVTLCGWWYVKIKELSLDRSTHLFLIMFFLAHHGDPFCSEYFPLFSFSPLFSTHIVSVVLFSSAAQVFSMGLFTCVNVLHFHSFF